MIRAEITAHHVPRRAVGVATLVGGAVAHATVAHGALAHGAVARGDVSSLIGRAGPGCGPGARA